MNTPVIIGIMAALVAGTAIVTAFAVTYAVQSDPGAYEMAMITNGEEGEAPGAAAGEPDETGMATGNTEEIGTITIGLTPVEKGSEPTAEAEALETFLESHTGADIEIVHTTDYETLIEGMRFGHIDAAFMDTGPAAITHQKTGAEVVLAELVDGKINYQATVWALADNDEIQTLEDTVGKKVAFTSITGSSGFIRPVGTLVNEGHIEIDGDDIAALRTALDDGFEAHNFAGGYKAALELLLNGEVDAAFGSDIAPKKYLEQEDQARLRAVTTVGPVPSHVVIVSQDMPGHARDALTSSLIRLNYDEDNHILTSLYGADALVPTTTSQHLDNFDELIAGLTGLDQLILDKYNKN